MSPENIRPLSPQEAVDKKLDAIPDAVIESFNKLLVRDLVKGYAVVRQKEIVALMKEKGIDAAEAFKNKWLDVEPLYQKAGWKVSYESPSYGDNYFEPYFTFKRPKPGE